MRITVTDRLSFRVNSQRRILENGYLAVPGRVARTGVQQYTAQELGLKDRPPGELINVYRPPEEVFKPESLASYDNVDITIQHPEDFVDSGSFREVSVGHATSPGRKDEEYVVVDLLIKAQEAIDAISKGTAELSAGYSSLYVYKPGIAPDGTPYEFIQVDILINHIALCDFARAGHQARLFDHFRKKKEPKPMPQITLDSGAKVEVADQSTATLIQTTLDSLIKRISSGDEKQSELEGEVAKLEVELEKKDEELEKLKAETSDSAIQRRVDLVVDALSGARKIVGASFTSDSMDPLVIKRNALDAAGIKCRKYGSWDKAPEAYISAWFDAEEEKKENEDDDDDENGKNGKENTNDSHRRFANDMSNAIRKNNGDAGQQRLNARQNFLDERYGRKSKGEK